MPAAELAACGPGALLALGRAEKGLSVAYIAAQLRYSTRQIEALEGDDFEKLPGMTFVRGMIRGYAKVLDIPSAPILRVLEGLHVPSPVTVDLHAKREPFPDGRARSTRIYLWLTIFLGLLVAAVLYEWHFGLPQPIAEAFRPSVREELSLKPAEVAVQGESVGPSAPPAEAVAPAEPPVLVANAGSALAAPPGASIRFEFQRDAWVEVKERSGRTLLAQLNPAGTKATVEGSPPFELIIGNAASVRLFYGDRVVDLRPHTKVDVARFTLE